MIETFISYLRFEKRFSLNTSISYQTDLLQLQEYLATAYQEKELSAATHPMIRSWIVSLVEQDLDSSSINRKIACLRSFYKFLLKQELVTNNPTTKIKILKTPKRLPQFVLENDMVSMLDKNEFKNDFSGDRDQLIIELLYGTGMRLSELIHLRVSQINLHERTLKVVGKRNKERVIPFSTSLVTLIDSYISLRKKELPETEHDFLIVTDRGERVYPMFVQRLVKKYLKVYSSVEKKSPHVLRHTYATHLLNKGAEINAVKDLLGHTSLAATQVYTHNSMEKLKRVFDQAHPKA
jgi:integrase/recombinase XerC